MGTDRPNELLDALLRIAEEAGRTVLEFYERGFAVDYKGPADPVTDADKAANELICSHLDRLCPGVPIVAEESDPESFSGWRDAEQVFFVDPLDGTKEFIARNGEFVVMIGLVQGARATAGVVVAPAQSRAWMGALDHGAYAIDAAGTRTRVQPGSHTQIAGARVLSSRSHRSRRTDRTLRHLGLTDVRQVGSAGLKGAGVAEGSADIYLAPGYAGRRWDACAIDALVCAAGGRFSDAFGKPIDYRNPNLDNRRGLLATNGPLHDLVLAELAQMRAAAAGRV